MCEGISIVTLESHLYKGIANQKEYHVNLNPKKHLFSLQRRTLVLAAFSLAFHMLMPLVLSYVFPFVALSYVVYLYHICSRPAKH